MGTSSDASASSPPLSALESIRALVRDKTRFEPEDIQQIREDESVQSFVLETAYHLKAKIEQMGIDGHFQAGKQDRSCDAPLRAAQAALSGRLKLAAQLLQQELQKPEIGYSTIGDGILLPHETKHWQLYNCSRCSGGGRVTCHTCHGTAHEDCWRCQGSRAITCDAFGCFLGKLNCSACHGTSSVSLEVSYQITVQVPVTNWVDGVAHTTYHTEYRTEYRWEQHPCTAFGCLFGKVQCGRCVGTGKINCNICFATGKMTCRTCSGVGTLMCEPCRGSGSLGSVAWVDIHVSPTYKLHLPEGSHADAQSICEKEGPHGLVTAAQPLRLVQVQMDPPDVPEALTACYRSNFRIVRLDAVCNHHDYHLVAYGRTLCWLTTDGIVEDLLRKDLEALQAVLSEVADDGLFSSRIDHLLEPLRHVTASELNAELVEAALEDGSPEAHAAVVSAEYFQNIQKSILGSLRQIYTRLAKRFWWLALLVCVGVTACVWSASTPDWGVLAGTAALVGASLLFTYRVRRILTRALGNPALAKRAMRIATRSKRYFLAQALILGPGTLGVLVLGLALPARGPWAIQVQPAPAAEPMAPLQAAGIASAMDLYKQGHLQQARGLLKQLAEKGDTAAAGPYGWMLLTLEGLSPEESADPSAQHALAKPWIDKGMAQKDTWATAAKGLALIQAWGESRDIAQGIELMKQAANAGHTGAMRNLGFIYAQGIYVPASMVESRKWFTMAADTGGPSDIYQLGLMDWYGEGISRPNRKRAMELWKKAAEQGEPQAQAALANGRPPKRRTGGSTKPHELRQSEGVGVGGAEKASR